MACFTCRWRSLFIYLCTSCISLFLLFVYAIMVFCIALNKLERSAVVDRPVRFVAPGTFTNGSFNPLPETFWSLRRHEDAIWNRLQLSTDRHFNPILRPGNIKTGSGNRSSSESLRKRAFSDVPDLAKTRKSFYRQPRIREFVSHMHRRDYPVLIQPHGGCGAGTTDESEAPLLLLAIKSIEMNFKNRQAIRQTWGQVGRVAGQWSNRKGGGGHVRRVFLLGNRNSGVNLSEALQMESDRHGDILQWDFRDTFFNLTMKDVLFWSWFSRSCERTLFVFKGDDDVFVNTPKMATFLLEQLKKPHANESIGDFMIGDVITAGLPNRVRRSKYFIPYGFYQGVYPMYAGGGGVVYSGLLARRLLHVSKRVHLFPIDDVYVGMCMIRINAHPVHHPAFLTFDFPKGEEQKRCSYHTILLVHKRNPTQIIKLWARLKMSQAQCRDTPLRGAEGEEENKPEL
ncbi:N-acetyllactosaminide beta-1,3-N-acetylglucosaminyltransferase 2 [Liparis tanakae]|uniref:Hexosyltransferase n=1 Tax=Liparis tanakae TaxID=230148 RepID=A0A4Z2HI80_9TELE|nr:N-acetyllactosaminide beta-1,3-N-acetylglucosaminyltransferase 2 [Liparis tanakae]